MAEAGRGRIIMEADASPALKGLKDLGSSAKGVFGGLASGNPFGGVADGLSGVLGKVGPLGPALAGIAAGAGAAAGALLKIGSDWDEASDLLLTKTGATGAAMKGLEGSLKNIVGTVPADVGQIAKVMADVAQQAGLTGKPLETLTKQMMEAGRMMGFEASEGVANYSKTLKLFGTPAKDATKDLDLIFKIAQKTGQPFEELLAKTSDLGPALKAMGFSAVESAGLIGQLGQAGIDVDGTMAGLKKALGGFTKAGIPAPEGLKAVFDKIKNAPNDLAAGQIAVDIFKEKAGPGLAAAIRTGKVELDALLGAVGASKTTILGSAEATKDWQEMMKQFSEQSKKALLPLAQKMLPLLADVMREVGPKVVEFFKTAVPIMEKWLPVVGELIKVGLIPLKLAFQGLKAIQGAVHGDLGPLKKLFEGIRDAIADVVKFIGKLIEKLLGIKLPKWLIPGSPTPFETGLWGIARAAAEVTRQMVQLSMVTGPRMQMAGGFGMGAAPQVSMPVTVQNFAPGTSVSVRPSGGGLIATLRANGINL